MKFTTRKLRDALRSEVTDFIICWKITRNDGQVFGYTSASEDLNIDGITYKANSVSVPSEFSFKAGGKVSNSDVDWVINDEEMSYKDFVKGVWESADLEVFIYSKAAGRSITLAKGFSGDMRLDPNKARVEFRSTVDKLYQRSFLMYSINCNASLGDERCGVDLAPWTFTDSIASGSSKTDLVLSTVSKTENFFKFGSVKILTGQNSGVIRRIGYSIDNKISLVAELPFDPASGDQIELVAGCDKTLETCKQKFSNTINYRGYPFIPGLRIYQIKRPPV